MSASPRVRFALLTLTLASACSSSSEPTDAGALDAVDSSASPDAASASDAGPDQSDEVYASDRVLTVEIELPLEDWATLRAQTRGLIETLGNDCLDGPFPSPFTWFEGSVTIDGERFERVDVRKKGFIGSLSVERPGLKLDLGEYVDGQSYSDVRRFTLNNSVADPALVRQCLGYSLFAQAGIPAPRCNFARVSVNGEDLGLYVNVEAIRGPFLRRGFGSSEGNLYEGTLSDFRPEMAATFEAKNNEEIVERTDIAAVVAALESPDESLLEALEALVDVDQFLTFWAMETLVVHTDGYNANRNNFYLYADPSDGRFRFLPWGIDGILDAQLVARELPQSVYARSILAHRLYQIPSVRSAYFERLDELLGTIWNEAVLDAEIVRMRDLLAPTVSGDSRARLLASIEQLRGAVAARRNDIVAELDIAQPDVGDLVAPLQCLLPVGTASGTFTTTWGTVEREAFFEGDATLDLMLDGEVVTFTMTGSAAGVGDDGPTLLLLGAPRFGVVYVVSFAIPRALVAPGMLAIDLLAVGGYVGVLRGGVYQYLGLAEGELVFDEASAVTGATVRGTFDLDVYRGL